MHIIPVIDILKGHAVHAYCGLREQYRPVQSRLCDGSDPEDIVVAFLDLHPFDVVYLADLDAIQGTGDNRPVIDRLVERYPRVEFWIDSGFVVRRHVDGSRTIPVLGTETGLSPDQLRQARDVYPDTVLSLDHNGGGYLGDRALLEQCNDWPRRCIVMNLAHVGSGKGPDLDLIGSISDRAPDRMLYAAGGIRDKRDLDVLSAAGVRGALLASALHDGSITADTLQAYSQD